MIRPAVTAAWRAFNEPLEGRVPHMYLDVRGLVTCGVGNLIDDLASAQALPWRRPGGELATPLEIEAQWTALRDTPELGKRSLATQRAFLSSLFGAPLTLHDDAIDALVGRKLEANARELARYFPEFATWPADAQLATLSLAWALGPAFVPGWPKLRAACTQQRWASAAAECEINAFLPPDYPVGHPKANPGVVPRNRLNREHLLAAASELATEYPSVLHGPRTLEALNAGWRPAGQR